MINSLGQACQDRNMRPAEVAAMRRLVERQARRP